MTTWSSAFSARATPGTADARSGDAATNGCHWHAAGNYQGMTTYPYDGGRPPAGQAAAQQVGLEKQFSRLDKLEQGIEAERERLNRPSADSRDQPGRRSGDQYDPRSGDRQEPVDAVREVDVPDLESRVTGSQREAWASGYRAGLSDAQSGGRATTNPFHPDCDDQSGRDIATNLREVSAQRLLSSVDCAVIDLGLPDANGVQALDRIRELAPQMPIVVLTGLHDGATGVAAFRRGAQDSMVRQHADGSAIARAVRFAIERKHQARSELDLHDDVIDRLQAIGLAMRTTQRGSTEQPALVGRITEHLSELPQVVDQIRCTITPARAADPDDGPLVW